MQATRPTRVLSLALLVSGLLAAPGCRGRNNLAGRVMDDPADELGEARCGGGGRIARPLLVEWSAPDRASLESRLRRGLVVVHYEGCKVDVLSECSAPEASYGYHGLTRKNDSQRIRTTDELYTNLPLSAVKLEGTLAKAGELNIEMAIVGSYEVPRSVFDVSELQGRCEGATHVVSLVQVGAFEFYAGSGAEVGAGVEVEGAAGVGGRSTAQHEVLNQDGDPDACEASTPSDAAPPPECGALLRLELSALDGVTPAGSTGGGGSSAGGSGGGGSSNSGGSPSGSGGGFGDPTFASPEDEALAKSLCEIRLKCDANTLGQQPSTGEMYDMKMRSCLSMVKMQLDSGEGPKLRECVEGAPSMSCIEFDTCTTLPAFDEDLMNNALGGEIGDLM